MIRTLGASREFRFVPRGPHLVDDLRRGSPRACPACQHQLFIQVLTDRASYGGPLVIWPLAILVPTAILMLPYVVMLVAWHWIESAARLAASVWRWAWGRLKDRRTR